MSLKSDTDDLARALEELRELLDDLRRHTPFRNADPELAQDLDTNWQAFSDRVDQVANELRSITSDQDTRAVQLEIAGLRGQMLAMKTRGFRSAKRNRHLSASKKPPWWLRKALRWANVMLGSLTSVIPGADLLKEYKEAAEIGIDEADAG